MTINPNRASWMTVARRELVVKITDKSFIISTVSSVAIMIAIFALQIFLASRPSTTTIVVTDDQARQVATTAGTTAHSADDTVTYDVVTAPDRAAAEEQVRSGDADVYLTHTDNNWQAVWHTSPKQAVDTNLQASVAQAALQHNADAAGVSVADLTKGSQLTSSALDAEAGQQEFLAIIAGLVFAALFYMSALLFGLQIAQAVVSEKQSRIVEILATAVPVRSLLIGKVVANTVLALGQLLLYLAIGVVGVSFTKYAGLLAQVGTSAAWFAVFFLVGFLALACLWAAAGAMATRTEDLQQTAGPLTMVLMVVFFAGLFVSGTAAQIVAYVPIVSSILMPKLLLSGEATWWQAVIALAVSIATTVGLVIIGEKLYRRSLFETGKTLTFRKALVR